jgi:hypothetical protein
MRIVSALFAVAACLVSTSAFALQQEAPQETEVYIFDPTDVTGRTNAPSSETIVVRENASFHSLLSVRTSFIDEVVKSAEEVSLR